MLKEYLNVFWLRPEVALWRTADALALGEFHFDSPSIDLGCGDGANSYILAGGSFPLEFDDFQSTKAVGPREFFSGMVDIYDDAQVEFPCVDPAPHEIDFGLDWKENLLHKAEKVHLYRGLICHDMNNELPFEDESFQSIFSNTLYWIENINVAVGEVGRVLRQGGMAAVLVPDARLKDYFLYRYVEDRGWKWCEALDMGRHSHIKHWFSEGQWRHLFQSARLKVVDHVSYMSSRLIEIHEIGLRPISPLLIKMSRMLGTADRSEIKREWIEYVRYLAEPLFTSGWIVDRTLPQTFHRFYLTRV